MTTPTIVIDPGEGEHALALALAVQGALQRHRRARVLLAPSTLGARERARVAFHNAADVFLCLGEGTAAAVATDPTFHHPATAVVRVPAGRALYGASVADDVERLLTTSDPDCQCGCADCSPARRSQVASVTREHIDVWNEVPLVPQRTGMSCWAAAAAMLVGWRDASVVDPEQIAHAAQQWGAYEGGLEPEDVPALARRWGLHQERSGRHSLKDFRRLLAEHGPLWVGEASPGLHSVVLTGMRGDGTPDGTKLHIADPWPLGQGERYSVSFRDFMKNFEAAAGIDGVDAQILHAGGRGPGPSRAMQAKETFTRSWTTERG